MSCVTHAIFIVSLFLYQQSSTVSALCKQLDHACPDCAACSVPQRRITNPHFPPAAGVDTPRPPSTCNYCLGLPSTPAAQLILQAQFEF